YDEAFQIPTEFSAEIALRTQQMIAYESGIARTVDPLGGSHFVEWLTDRMEEEVGKVIEEIDDYGGVVKAIEDGYLQARIAERARQRKQAIDSGETVIVGLNHFRREDQTDAYGEVFKLDPGVADRVREKFAAVMARRDGARVSAALSALEEAAAKDDENLMPHLIECCHAYASVGEMVGALKRQWGEFEEPIRF